MKWSDIALLFRGRAQMGEYQRELARQNIPVNVVGGLGFFEQREVKDLISLLSFAINPSSTYDVQRLASNFKLGIGEKLQAQIFQKVDLHDATHSDILDVLENDPDFKKRKTEGFKELVGAVTSVSTASVYPFIIHATTRLDIRQKLEDEDRANAAKGVNKGSSRVESFDAFITSTRQFNGSVEEFLDDLFLDANEEEDTDNAVTISTIHAAKGREWEVVFIPQMVDDKYPHAMSKTPEELDQEFNCYFVAKTRAKSALIMSRSKINPQPYGNQLQTSIRSRFISNELKELNKHGTASLLK